MDEKTFKKATEQIYERIIRAFDRIDPDIAEADLHLDNVTIRFASGTRFIVNRQNPVRQIWLATKKQGLHFTFSGETNEWICNKTGGEFFSVLRENCYAETAQRLEF